MCPQFKNHITHARRSLKGWHIIKPSVSAVPLTKDFMLAFCFHMCKSQRFISSVLLAVSWGGYLRVSEALSLRWKDLALPGDPRISQFGNNTAGINIHWAKFGRMQFVPIRDTLVVQFLQCYAAATPRAAKGPMRNLFPITYFKYRASIKLAAAAFGLQNYKFTPHSARIGGALHDFCSGVSAETIALTGRWATLSSLRYYLTNGRAWVLNISMDAQSRQNLQQAMQGIRIYIATLRRLHLS